MQIPCHQNSCKFRAITSGKNHATKMYANSMPLNSMQFPCRQNICKFYTTTVNNIITHYRPRPPPLHSISIFSFLDIWVLLITESIISELKFTP